MILVTSSRSWPRYVGAGGDLTDPLPRPLDVEAPFSEPETADFCTGDVGAPFETGENPFALFEVEDVLLSGRILARARRLRLEGGSSSCSWGCPCSPLPSPTIAAFRDWVSGPSAWEVGSRRRRRRRREEGSGMAAWSEDTVLDAADLRLGPAGLVGEAMLCLHISVVSCTGWVSGDRFYALGGRERLGSTETGGDGSVLGGFVCQVEQTGSPSDWFYAEPAE